MVKTRFAKRARERDEGEIVVDRADKRSRPGDAPPPAVARDAMPPREKAGYGRHTDPQDRGVVQDRYEPEPNSPRRPAKRLPGNYEGCKPARLCAGPLQHSSATHPIINNLSDPRDGIITSEDNALAVAQAVGHSCQKDLDHYMTPERRYEREWIQKDVKVGLTRALTAYCAQERMYEDLAQTSRGQARVIRNLENKVAKAEGEAVILKKRAEHDKVIVTEAMKKVAIAETRAELLAQEVEKWKAEAEKRKEVDLREIRAKHFVDWMEDWLNQVAGEKWLEECSRGARAEGWRDAVLAAKAEYPAIDTDLMMRRMTYCEGIGFKPDGRAFFISQEGDEATTSARADAEAMVREMVESGEEIRRMRPVSPLSSELLGMMDKALATILPSVEGPNQEAESRVMEVPDPAGVEGSNPDEGRVALPTDGELAEASDED